MAIKKVTNYRVQCEGVCCSHPERVVEKVPVMWSMLKIEPATKPVGQPLEYLVTTLCGSCTIKAIQVLKDAGFRLTTVGAKVERKGNSLHEEKEKP